MILEEKEHKEYHRNGTIWITGTIGIIAPLWKHRYHYLVAPDGTPWCRTGIWEKHYDNGQLAWTIEYDAFGKCTDSKFPQFLRDGTPIGNK